MLLAAPPPCLIRPVRPESLSGRADSAAAPRSAVETSMSASPKPQEPSMEEILASIRRIIADDQGRMGHEDVSSAPAEPDTDAEPRVAEFPPPPVRLYEDERFDA